MSNEHEGIREAIRKNYSGIATGNSSCCCSSGCCTGAATDVKEVSLNIGYTEEDIENAVTGSNMGLGCGNPVALADIREGETVLDLGCGGGFDCFLASRRTGAAGHVIGVDMTPEMISLARKNAEKSGITNVDFRLGEIERLPVADSTVDVILSNCVINLSQDKASVFREAYRVLKPGGRLSISDVVATAPLPEEVRRDAALISGCIGGAEYVGTLEELLDTTGFVNILLTPKDNSREIIHSWVPDSNLEDYVASYQIEAFKPVDSSCGSQENRDSCCCDSGCNGSC